MDKLNFVPVSSLARSWRIPDASLARPWHVPGAFTLQRIAGKTMKKIQNIMYMLYISQNKITQYSTMSISLLRYSWVSWIQNVRTEIAKEMHQPKDCKRHTAIFAAITKNETINLCDPSFKLDHLRKTCFGRTLYYAPLLANRSGRHFIASTNAGTLKIFGMLAKQFKGMEKMKISTAVTIFRMTEARLVPKQAGNKQSKNQSKHDWYYIWKKSEQINALRNGASNVGGMSWDGESKMVASNLH